MALIRLFLAVIIVLATPCLISSGSASSNTTNTTVSPTSSYVVKYIACTNLNGPYMLNASATEKFLQLKWNFSIPPETLGCSAIIKAPRGFNIQLMVDENAHQKCPSVHYDIYDGDSDNSEVIMSTCGSLLMGTLGYPVFSTGRYLYVHFRKVILLGALENGGLLPYFIRLTYMATETASTCSYSNPAASNKIIKATSSGDLRLPSPLTSSLLDCQWRISAPDGYFIKLSVPKYPGNTTNRCLRFDVYDNQFSIGPEIFDYRCPRDKAQSAPRTVYSTGRHMVVRYSRTKENTWNTLVRNQSLLASFTSVKHNISGSCVPGRASVIKISGSYGAISTNDLSRTKPYNATIDCTWIVTAPQGSRVKLALQPMSYTSYSRDIAELRDGASASSTLLRKSCLNSLQDWPVYSSGEQVSLRVLTPAGVRPFTSGSFYITHEAVPRGTSAKNVAGVCSPSNTHDVNHNIVPSDSVGIFEGAKGAGISCTWKLTAPFGKYVKLVLKKYDMDCKHTSETLVVTLPGDEKALWKRDCDKTFLEVEELSTGESRSVWVHYEAGCQTMSGGEFLMQYSYELTIGTKIGIAFAAVLVAVIVFVVYKLYKRQKRRQQHGIRIPESEK